ncbi:MAG TPA: ABC transporter permease subunit [Ktedonobacterales bacterium]
MTFSTLATKSPTPTWVRGPVEETLRLGLWNLFLAWRRTMSKVLLGVLLGAYALLVLGLLLLYVIAASNNSDVAPLRAPLTFPDSLMLTGGLVRYLAPLLAAILAGALIGGEYAFGTYRLSLARGNSRAQVLGGQVLALAFIALITSGLMLVIGLLVGVTLGPLLGSDLVIPYPDGWLQIAIFWLALSLNIWGYTLVALFFATLGRSAAAGIGGALGAFVVEFVLAVLVFPAIAAILGALHLTRTADFFAKVPYFFFGQSLGATVTYSQLHPIQLASSPPNEPLALALVVVLIYCAALIAGSYALFKQRDIAE